LQIVGAKILLVLQVCRQPSSSSLPFLQWLVATAVRMLRRKVTTYAGF